MKTVNSISMVLPIGVLPFFVNACLQNITETCGYQLAEFDLVFVVLEDVSVKVLKALKEAEKKFRFRVIHTPFKFRYNEQQLNMMDWVIRNGNLRDWVIVQHCDWLSHTPSWMKLICKTIEENPKAVYISYPYGTDRWQLDGKSVCMTNDVFAVHKKSNLLDNDYRFLWGNLKDLKYSPMLAEAVQAKRFSLDGQIIDMERWIDGNDLIGYELLVRDPDLMKIISLKYTHPWSIFRVATRCIRHENKLMVEHLAQAAIYSKMSSYLFDIDSFEDPYVPLPWTWFLQVYPWPEADINQANHAFNVYKRYADPNAKVLGDGVLEGINIIDYSGRIFYFNNDKLCMLKH